MLVFEILKMQKMSAIKAMRTLRALRPLRAVSRWEGMRVCITNIHRRNKNQDYLMLRI
jgi:hypothetical protein